LFATVGWTLLAIVVLVAIVTVVVLAVRDQIDLPAAVDDDEPWLADLGEMPPEHDDELDTPGSGRHRL
jgi:hypothetical protein